MGLPRLRSSRHDRLKNNLSKSAEMKSDEVRNEVQYRRPLLKLSGEMLGGESGFGFDRVSIESYANYVARLVKYRITPAIVLGGGNFFRGAKGHLPAMSRPHADFVGMTATLMNAVCFADHLRAEGVKCKVFSAVEAPKICSPYQIDDAVDALEKGIVCLFAGGTGNPYFSTDSAAALRAIEVGCDILIKATKVDGVYDKDPKINHGARKFEKISYGEVLRLGLGVMDLVAIALCRENRMPLIVLSMAGKDNLLKACCGKKIGTKVVED